MAYDYIKLIILLNNNYAPNAIVLYLLHSLNVSLSRPILYDIGCTSYEMNHVSCILGYTDASNDIVENYGVYISFIVAQHDATSIYQTFDHILYS